MDSSTSLHPTAASRQSRYKRNPQETTLTPQKWRLLQAIAQCRVVSSHQLARLLKLGDKTTRYHLRQLFDAGLTDIVPVSRMSLVDPGQAIDHGILFGSAPNVYTPTKEGMKQLVRAGLMDDSVTKIDPYKYTVRNSMYLAHELMVRDIYVWLKSIENWEMKRWETGDACAITLPHKRVLRPDALAVATKDSTTLAAFVEADRGTERGNKRWEEKYRNYAMFMANEAQVKAVTGYLRARVIVTVPTDARATQLCALIDSFTKKTPILPRRFYIAPEGALLVAGLGDAIWHVPGETGLQGMV